MTVSLPQYKDEEGESQESMANSLKTYIDYLNNLCTNSVVARSKVFLEFCEVSRFTLIERENQEAQRIKEGYL